MGLQTINNGTFDFDLSAEKVRISFDKVKAMFAEIYEELPLDTLLAGNAGLFLRVKATEDGYELAAIPGGGDLLASNNLNEFAGDPSQAKNNLGLGSAADAELSDFATSAQGGLADSAIQSIQQGDGVSIDITDPTNPEISFNGVTVIGLSVNALSKTLTLEVSGGSNISLDMSNYLKLLINGLDTIKGTGNTNPSTHENGDLAYGWEGENFIAFKQESGVRRYALNQGLL
ncbi:MAG: hypothetical protein AAGF96_05880 [Bacteroidota bacterium]